MSYIDFKGVATPRASSLLWPNFDHTLFPSYLTFAESFIACVIGSEIIYLLLFILITQTRLCFRIMAVIYADAFIKIIF